MKIAMWSGPRNLSTAMMYAFGNRADCAVSDEPLYAAYLARTGLDHPMRDDILASQPVTYGQAVGGCLGENPYGKPIWYQKHMTHHILEGDDLGWLDQMVNVFLIRHPARIIASYAKKRENPTLGDLGFVEQRHIFDHCRAMGQTPLVIDSDDVLHNPTAALSGLCAGLGVPFDPAMTAWRAGPRKEDGIWAAHWYDAVHKSTGFGAAPSDLPVIDERFSSVYDTAMEIYDGFRA